MLHIYDGNNHFRRVLETDFTGLAVRTVYNETMMIQDPVIFVWDGPNALQTRRTLYPEYKSKRVKPNESVFEAMGLCKKLLRLSNAIQVEVPGYEADDVIATVVKKVPDRKINVFVHSNDADFAQLGVQLDRKEFKIEPQFVRLYKTLVGDHSDNIPGIKGFGQKTWDSIDKYRVLMWATDGFKDEPPFELSPIVKKFFANDGAETLRLYWKVIGFFDVPKNLIDKHTVVGTPLRQDAERIMKEFMI